MATMYAAFRVRKTFGWGGWQFSPGPSKPCRCRSGLEICHQSDDECNGLPGTSCTGCTTTCNCPCRIDRRIYGGDVWIVEERHPRLESMMNSRQAIPDPSLPPIDEILEYKRYSRLLKEPREVPSRKAAARA